MPRVGPEQLKFPWEDWTKQLAASPTGSLIFDSEDFGDIGVRAFRTQALRAWKPLGASVQVRGDEVWVIRA